MLRLAAHYGPVEPGFGLERPLTRGSAAGRAVVDRELIHIEDLMTVVTCEFPEAVTARERMGGRTVLAAPLLREGVAIGVILIRRTEVRPFQRKTDRSPQNLRRPGRDRHRERATVYGAAIAQRGIARGPGASDRNGRGARIISRSPTDVQPVLDAIVESAARVCGIDDVVLRLREGDIMIPRGHFGPVPITRVQISVDEPYFHWMREHGTLHIPDINEQAEVSLANFSGNWRTVLYVPLRQQREIVGHLSARRIQVSPFTPAQIKLLETFADQAVIAIENVRLFHELKESLEQQTATSEILGRDRQFADGYPAGAGCRC